MKNFYRILCISSLGVLISNVVAHASVVLMGVAMATLGAIIAGTGLLAGYSIMQAAYPGTGAPASGAATVTPAGTIGRQTTVQWVDLKDFDVSGAPKVKQSEKTVKITADALKGGVQPPGSNNPYPRLSNAVYKDQSFSPPFDPLSPSSHVKDGIYTYNGSHYKVVQSPYYVGAASSSNAGTVKYWPQYGFFELFGSASGTTCPMWRVGAVPTTAPPPSFVPRNNSEIASALANKSTALSQNEPVFSDALGELDDFIKDNPGSVSIIEGSHDGVTDSAPPATLPAPVTQAAYDAAAAIGGASAAATQAASSAAGSLATAQGNYNCVFRFNPATVPTGKRPLFRPESGRHSVLKAAGIPVNPASC